jgi:hypothetical protein
MARSARAVALLVLVGLAGYVAWGVYERIAYAHAYTATQPGDTLQSVLKRFGRPSHVEPHYNVSGWDKGDKSVCGGSCSQRFWYDQPLSLGTTSYTVAFDSRRLVIDKYIMQSP